MGLGQFNFNLGYRPNFSEEDYQVTNSNYDAYKIIDQWPNWGNYRLANIIYIQGPKGSGKTHLSHIWQKKTGAVFINETQLLQNELLLSMPKKCFILENLENYGQLERELFHFLNLIVEEKKYLILTSQLLPQDFSCKLKDLDSRLKGVTLFSINSPDDELLKALLIKQCSDRQIRIASDVVNYLVNHIERSYQAVQEMVELIDKQTLSSKRSLTIPLIKEIFSV